MKCSYLAALVCVGSALLITNGAEAAEHTVMGPHSVAYQNKHANSVPRRAAAWSGDYYNVQFGSPVALVVPPTAEKYREMGWGVGNVRMRRIYPQFRQAYPGTLVSGSQEQYRATPPWPSDTTQFGIYYVRGPW